jgi:hypothetical protein
MVGSPLAAVVHLVVELLDVVFEAGILNIVVETIGRFTLALFAPSVLTGRLSEYSSLMGRAGFSHCITNKRR